MVAIAATPVAFILHYLVAGPRRAYPKGQKPSDKANVSRFGFFERLVHAVTMIGLVVLAATGFWCVIALSGPLHGCLWIIHVAAGAALALGVMFMSLLWSKDARFMKHDWIWLRYMGGYLGGDRTVPAARFNAGQKGFFWSTLMLGVVSILSGVARISPEFCQEFRDLVLQAHRYGTLMFVLSVLVHLYLATLANPGTVMSIITGKVRPKWAAHHHPLWWEEINRAGKRSGK